jgi:seryl-tRNA synthetase
MSLKSELQEVVDWLSDLTAGSQPTPEPVYREDWYLVRDNLRKAAEHFQDAIAALERNRSSLVDFARDLEREAEGLSLRAESLARRSPKKPPVGDATAALMKQLEEKQKELNATEKKLHDITKQFEAAKKPAGPATIAPAEAEKRKETEEEPGPSAFVNDAAGSLETAHLHIVADGDAPPDAVADAFATGLSCCRR